ncbi:MAG: hypothetical protein N3B21_19435 [Clostridia bacterium]|nr:hypothetical protein [Clostridia bacterium]
MAKEIKVRSLAKYNGHSLKNNKAVDLGLKFAYEELPNYIKLIQFLNENTTITIKRGNNPPQKLGIFMVKEIKIDHDGEGVVKFNSQLDHVEADEITTIVGDEIFKVMFEAKAEEVEEDGDE